MTIPVFQVTFISPLQASDNLSTEIAYGEQSLSVLYGLYSSLSISHKLIGYQTITGFIPKKTI